MTGRCVPSRNECKNVRQRLRRAVESLEPRRFLSSSPLNVQVTTDPDVQQQPSVVADPNHPQHVVVAYMDRSLVTTGYAGIGVSISEDGGKSWTKSSIPLPDGFDGSAANPIAKYDDRGHLFVSFMATTFLGASRLTTIPAVQIR